MTKTAECAAQPTAGFDSSAKDSYLTATAFPALSSLSSSCQLSDQKLSLWSLILLSFYPTCERMVNGIAGKVK